MMNNKPTHKYLPEHAIWLWTTEKTKSSITVVNNKYKYEVFNIVTGERLHMGYSVSMTRAKKRVLKLTEQGGSMLENELDEFMDGTDQRFNMGQG